jgi:hypothetical protein
MVRDTTWVAAGMPRQRLVTHTDYLCVHCLERRLGRAIRPSDFTGAPINSPSPWDTPRLRARKLGEAEPSADPRQAPRKGPRS